MIPKTSIEGIEWPAVPDGKGAVLLSLLFQLEQSQWWSAERIAERQSHQLGLLLAHAGRTVPFYRDRLGLVGIAPDGPATPPVTPEHWSRIPLLRRTDIQAAGDALLSDALPPSHGRTSEIYTSGSTGKPIRVVRSQAWSLFWSAFTLRDHLWHRRDMSGKLADIRQSARGKALYPEGAPPRAGAAPAAGPSRPGRRSA